VFVPSPLTERKWRLRALFAQEEVGIPTSGCKLLDSPVTPFCSALRYSVLTEKEEAQGLGVKRRRFQNPGLLHSSLRLLLSPTSLQVFPSSKTTYLHHPGQERGD
jgi:hypothetical protein